MPKRAFRHGRISLSGRPTRLKAVAIRWLENQSVTQIPKPLTYVRDRGGIFTGEIPAAETQRQLHERGGKTSDRRAAVA